MIEHILRYTAPAAYALLPQPLQSIRATAQLLAIGLHESRFEARRQRHGGPARGYWMFEAGPKSGLAGLMHQRATKTLIDEALTALCYGHLIGHVPAVQMVLEHNDTLAFVVARVLVWTVPEPLPRRGQRDMAYRQYLTAWRPGVERAQDWDANYDEAWNLVENVYNGDGRPSP